MPPTSVATTSKGTSGYMLLIPVTLVLCFGSQMALITYFFRQTHVNIIKVEYLYFQVILSDIYISHCRNLINLQNIVLKSMVSNNGLTLWVICTCAEQKLNLHQLQTRAGAKL